MEGIVVVFTSSYLRSLTSGSCWCVEIRNACSLYAPDGCVRGVVPCFWVRVFCDVGRVLVILQPVSVVSAAPPATTVSAGCNPTSSSR